MYPFWIGLQIFKHLFVESTVNVLVYVSQFRISLFAGWRILSRIVESTAIETWVYLELIIHWMYPFWIGLQIFKHLFVESTVNVLVYVSQFRTSLFAGWRILSRIVESTAIETWVYLELIIHWMYPFWIGLQMFKHLFVESTVNVLVYVSQFRISLFAGWRILSRIVESTAIKSI